MTPLVSHWFAGLGAGTPTRPPLDGPCTVDVCVVGGGYTGLWTAYELRRADPSLSVLVVEREFCGFGASGRNGGWVQGEIAGPADAWRALGGPDGPAAMHRAARDAVDEVERTVRREGIACDFHRGGTLTVAQTPVELQRLHAQATEARSDGVWDDGADRLLDAAGLAARVAVRGGLGAWANPHCARVQPARLVVGLARAAEAAGVRIVEGTPVTSIVPARAGASALARTPRGDVRARWVVRATEAYTGSIAGHERDLAPVNSSMIVTEPLGDALWSRIGWAGAETILDGGLLYHYLQRTADGRVAIGGRGVPYRFGSRTDREGPVPARTVVELRDGLERLLGPDLAAVPVAAAWHGVLGVPRDWTPGVSADPETGLAWAGGYVGEGVAAANLAGRTLRDLLLGRDSDLARLPWVLPPGVPRPRWEPEPLRFVGVRGVSGLLSLAQDVERRTGRPSRIAAVADRIAGR